MAKEVMFLDEDTINNESMTQVVSDNKTKKTNKKSIQTSVDE
jgi:hypothetical protein